MGMAHPGKGYVYHLIKKIKNMAKYGNTKAKINEKITTNSAQAITGNVLNEVLQTMVDSLGADYQFGGLVQPGSTFTAGEQPVVFLATTPGPYTNFGGIVVADGEVALLVWSGTAWSKQTPDIATRTELSQLGQKVTLSANTGVASFIPAFEEENYSVTSTTADVKPTAVIPGQRVKVYVKSSDISRFAVYDANNTDGGIIAEIPNGTDFSQGAILDFRCPETMVASQYGTYQIVFRTWAATTLSQFNCYRLEPNQSTEDKNNVGRIVSLEANKDYVASAFIRESITSEGFEFFSIVYDINGNPTTAGIHWADGGSGVMTIHYDNGVIDYIDYIKESGTQGGDGTYRQLLIYSDGIIIGNTVNKIS